MCQSYMCDMKSSNSWTLMVLNSSNGWTQIVQVSVFRQIRLIGLIRQNSQKEFEKT